MSRRLISRFIALFTILGATLGLAAGSETTAYAIEGGTLTDSSETGWAVALRISSTSDDGWMECSGSFVSSNWVLTAAHCVTNANLEYAYASIGASINRNFPSVVTRVVAHPYYDVALVRLDSTGRAVLPFASQNLTAGEAGEAYGFGTGLNLKTTQLSALGTLEDGYLYARSARGNYSEVGDSGGPLISGGKLYGVLSAAVQTPRGYLRFEDYKYVPSSSFANWIFETIGVSSVEGTTGAAPSPQPNPQPKPGAAPGRIAGSNRVETSLQAWRQGGFTSSSLVIATGKAAPDALSAGPLAAALGAPLVLSNGPFVEPGTVAEIQARGIRDVRLVGGQVAFDPATLGDLQARGVQVSRIYGMNRYGTAAAVAAQTIAEWNQRGITQTPILVADGLSFPDALSAGAGAAFIHGVVVLNAGASLPPETAEFIQNHQVQSGASIFPIGGPAVRAWNQAGLAGYKSQPIQGLNRYQTAQFVAQAFAPGASSAVIASGVNFPDGLAGAALAAHRNACLLLTHPGYLSAPTAARLAQLPNRASSVVIGGPGAVSETAAWAVRG